MTQKELLINNYESIKKYEYVYNNKKIYGIYVILLLILSFCLTNTIFFIKINNMIHELDPYLDRLKILINLACNDLQC